MSAAPDFRVVVAPSGKLATAVLTGGGVFLISPHEVVRVSAARGLAAEVRRVNRENR